MEKAELEERVGKIKNQFKEQFAPVEPQGFIDYDDQRVCLEALTTFDQLGDVQLYLTAERGSVGIKAFAELYPSFNWEHEKLGAFEFGLGKASNNCLYIPFDGGFGKAVKKQG